jgi:tRNA(Ile)-lysidine synthase
LLDDLASIDATQLDFDHANKRQLKLEGLKDLSLARTHNLLRWWLAQNAIAMPSTQQCLQISQQLLTAKVDAQINIKVADNLQIKRYQSVAYLVETQPALSPINQLWQGEDTIILPDSSVLHFSKILGAGLAINRLDVGKLRIQYRNGGERFKADLNRPSRTLKHVLQNHALPPWVRERLPLIFMDETLVMIPNVGVDAQFSAQSHELGLQVCWLPV